MKKAIVLALSLSLLTSCVTQQETPRISYRDMPCTELYGKMIEVEAKIHSHEPTAKDEFVDLIDSIGELFAAANDLKDALKGREVEERENPRDEYREAKEREIAALKLELVRVENIFYAKRCNIIIGR